MNTSLKGRDWLMTQDWSVEEIETALEEDDGNRERDEWEQGAAEQLVGVDARQLIADAISRYVRAVKDGTFPSAQHLFE